MPLDFPNNPTIGQIFGDVGLSWTWDGVKWTSVPTNLTGPFLPIAGGQMGGPLTSSSTIASGTTLGSASRPGFLMFSVYRGDNTHPWFTGGNWGFGWNPTTLTAAAIRPLSIFRDAAYTGSLVGANPGALQITNTIGAGVTGLECALISTINNNATAGLATSGIFNVAKTQAGPGTIALNVVAGCQSGRISSIAGANVAMEVDANASGPDDIGVRVNTEMTFREFTNSSDGATTFLYGAIRCRGPAVVVTQGVGQTAPVTATHAFGATTINEGLASGFEGGFVTPFWADGCSGAAYSAVSAVQQLATAAAVTSGATAITLTNPLPSPSYVWVGALVTGTNIPAGRLVATSAYDSTNQITTITLNGTVGALTAGQLLTFTNAIGTGFKAGGYLTTAAFNSPGFNVSPSGAVTMAGAGFNGTTPIAKPTITGAKGSNAALASLLTALEAYGLITNATSA